MSNKGLRVRLPVILLLILISVLLGGVAGSWYTAERGKDAVPIFLAGAASQDDARATTGGFRSIVAQAIPAVASVSSTRIVTAPTSGQLPPGFRDFFGDMFGDQNARPQREQGLGSAVIVSPEGYLLTNNHVVEGASDIQVTLHDGRDFKAEIVGLDPKTDIAVIKVEETNLPVLVLADSNSVEVGDFVLAIGNPFGIGQTVTFGIASATGRGGLGIEEYEDFIQTDAAINPGNSGGALIDVRGELIGINTAIIGPSGGNLGVGFAVPSNMARQIMEQILKHGKVIRGWLGVVIQPVTAKEAGAFGLSQPRGALIGDVSPDSPAEKGGLRRGDIILDYDGNPVTDMRDLSLKIALSEPGTAIRFKVFRDRREQDLSIKLGERPTETEERSAIPAEESPSGLEGMRLQDLTPQISQKLGLPEGTRGAVVTGLEPDSPAADAGLRPGDVIVEVNRQAVSSVSDFNRIIRQAGKGTILLLINRGGVTSFVVLENG